MRRAIALVPLALVIAAGCGGGDDGEGDEGGAAAHDIQPEAQQRAESLVLQLSDFPEGWRASPAENDEDDGELNRCLGSDYSELTLTGEADSQTFAMGESTEVASDAAILNRIRTLRPRWQD